MQTSSRARAGRLQVVGYIGSLVLAYESAVRLLQELYEAPPLTGGGDPFLVEALARPSYTSPVRPHGSGLLPAKRVDLTPRGAGEKRPNPSQEAAVKGIVGGLSLIQGPPGTGKSSTIVSIIRHRVAPHARVIVTCQTNSAVDAVAMKVADAMPGQVLVIGSEKALFEKKCFASLANTLSVDSLAARNDGRKGRLQADPVDAFWSEVAEIDVPELRQLQEALVEDDVGPGGGLPGAALAAAAAALLAKLRDHVAMHAGRYSRGLPLEFAAPWHAAHDELRAFLGGACPDAGAGTFGWAPWIQRAGHVADSVCQSQLARILGTARVWLSTIDTLPVLAEGLDEISGKGDGEMDPTIIVDEAGTVAEYSMPILLQMKPKNLILVGDHFQLPPFTIVPRAKGAPDGAATALRRIDRVITECGHGRSTMERVAAGWEKAPAARQARLLRLMTQYRMHPRICAMVSELTYGGWLHSAEGLALSRSEFCDPETGGDACLLKWVNVNGVEATRDTSYVNRLEVQAVVEQAAAARSRVRACSIFIIAFYSAQVRAITKALELAPLEGEPPEIITVDSVQGREADVVILSLVRCPSEPGAAIPYIRSRQRLNVAVSRAQAAGFGGPPRRAGQRGRQP